VIERTPPASARPPLVLSLRELEPLSGLRPPWLLALHRAGIAREQPQVAQLAPMRFIHLHERARHRQPQRAGLSAQATTLQMRLHIEAAQCVRGRERLLNGRHQRRTRKVIAQGTAVHIPFAGSRADVQAADGFLAPPNRVRQRPVGHYLLSLLLRFRTVGCCAACGCSASGYTRNLRRSFWRPSAFLGNMPYTAFSITRSGCLASIVANGVNRSCPMYPV